MTEDPDSTDPAKVAILGAAHISLSNLISYTLVTAAGMLAFFFAFQASLLANYHSIHSALLDKSIIVGKSSLPIGKLALSCICVSVIIFNVWSYKVIKLCGYYIESYLRSGDRLERSVGLLEGIYISLFEKRQLGRSGHLFLFSSFSPSFGLRSQYLRGPCNKFFSEEFHNGAAVSPRAPVSFSPSDAVNAASRPAPTVPAGSLAGDLLHGADEIAAVLYGDATQRRKFTTLSRRAD